MSPSWLAALLALLAALAPVLAAAQSEGYPSRPVRFVVPSAPGGESDLILVDAPGCNLVLSASAEFAAFVASDFAAKAQMIRASGAKAE